MRGVVGELGVLATRLRQHRRARMQGSRISIGEGATRPPRCRPSPSSRSMVSAVPIPGQQHLAVLQRRQQGEEAIHAEVSRISIGDTQFAQRACVRTRWIRPKRVHNASSKTTRRSPSRATLAMQAAPPRGKSRNQPSPSSCAAARTSPSDPSVRDSAPPLCCRDRTTRHSCTHAHVAGVHHPFAPFAIAHAQGAVGSDAERGRRPCAFAFMHAQAASGQGHPVPHNAAGTAPAPHRRTAATRQQVRQRQRDDRIARGRGDAIDARSIHG